MDRHIPALDWCRSKNLSMPLPWKDRKHAVCLKMITPSARSYFCDQCRISEDRILRYLTNLFKYIYPIYLNSLFYNLPIWPTFTAKKFIAKMISLSRSSTLLIRFCANSKKKSPLFLSHRALYNLQKTVYFVDLCKIKIKNKEFRSSG